MSEPYSFKPISKLFSYDWRSVQRLPNSNTLSLECRKGRVFEIIPQGEIVWEYISPFAWGRETKGCGFKDLPSIHRYAYDKFPGADKYSAQTDGHLGYTPAKVPIPSLLGLPRGIENVASCNGDGR